MREGSRLTRRCSGLALLAVIATASQGAAQTTPGKFWASIGLSYGALSSDGTYLGGPTGIATTDGATLGSFGAIAISGYAGEAVNRWMRLGGGIHYLWLEGGGNPTITDVQGVISYHLPGKRGPGPCLVTLGIGASHYNQSRASNTAMAGTAPATADGWSVALGLEYDIGIGHGLFLTPVVRYLTGHMGDLVIPASAPIASGMKQNGVEVGVSVTFH